MFDLEKTEAWIDEKHIKTEDEIRKNLVTTAAKNCQLLSMRKDYIARQRSFKTEL